MTAGDVVIERRGDLHDRVFLNVELEIAPDPAIGTYRRGHRLRLFVPAAGLSHVVLRLEHEGAGRAHPDAVTAVHTCRLWKDDVELGGDPGVEAPAGHLDGERVLRVGATSLDALVTKDALGVVADVEVVLDLDRLGHHLRGGRYGHLMMAGVTDAVHSLGASLAVTIGVHLVMLHPGLGRIIDERHVD